MSPIARRWLPILVGCLLAVVAAAGIALTFYSPFTKARVERLLENRFASKVDIGSFHATLFP